MKTNKRQIAEAALKLFAERGFDAVSTGDIAEEVGVTKGALYRHFTDKKSILDEILRQAAEDDALTADKFNLPTEDVEPTNCQAKDVEAFCRAMFAYWTGEFGSALRKLAMLERYKNPTMQKLFDDCFGSGPLSYCKNLLQALRVTDEIAAVRLYAPMFYAMWLYDDNPESANKIANDHFDDFFAQLK